MDKRTLNILINIDIVITFITLLFVFLFLGMPIKTIIDLCFLGIIYTSLWIFFKRQDKGM